MSNRSLDADAVRRRAISIPGCNEIPCDAKAAVSFLTGSDASSLTRVTIFCDTGTVSTARILGGNVRQVFRRNITSLDVIERLLRQPVHLTAVDKNLIGMSDTNDNGNGSKTVREAIDLADAGLAILRGEQEKLKAHLASVKATSPTRPPPEPKENSSPTRNHGMEFQFSLPPEAMRHVDQCLSDIYKMGKLVKCVATNGKGTVFLYGHGGVAYTPNIPRALQQKLSQLRNSKMSSRPSYVSLGTRNRFFVSFNDGTFAFKGPKELEKELKKTKMPPKSVAFGKSYDSFFLVRQDGSWKARDLPEAMELKLEQRDDRPDLACANLGPNGEWFIRARNGRMWWGAIGDDMDSSIQDLLDDGHYLNFLDFGEDGSYFVSYD